MPIPPLTRQEQAAGVMMLPIPYAGRLSEVRGQAEAMAVPGVVELTITAEPGDELVRFLRGHATWGFSWHGERHRRRWNGRFGTRTAD